MNIVITCKREKGRFRAKTFHPVGRKEWPAGYFTPEQLIEIKNDEFLIVDEPPETADQAIESAFALLAPWLKVPQEEARIALLNMVQGEELSPPEAKEPETASGKEVEKTIEPKKRRTRHDE